MIRKQADSEITVDLGDGCWGMIAINSICNGTSSGGVRIADNIDKAEIHALASEMSLKYAFSGLPRGGAKTGICLPGDLDLDTKFAYLRKFGAGIAVYINNGVYYPGMDMNCGPRELTAIYQGAGIAIGKPTDTSLFTAMSASEALWAYKQSGVAAEGQPLRLMIEGFGSVAAYLAQRLPQELFKIVGVSTVAGSCFKADGFSSAKLVAAREEHGDELVQAMGVPGQPREKLFEVEADVFIPSARVGSLDEDIARTLRVGAVIPVANAPYAGDAVQILEGRGVFCAPGYVVNNGGVFASSLYDSGVSTNAVDRICVDHYRPVLAALLKRARQLDMSVMDLAEKVALQQFSKDKGEIPSLRTRISRKLERNRHIPRSIRGHNYKRGYVKYLRELGAEILTFQLG